MTTGDTVNQYFTGSVHYGALRKLSFLTPENRFKGIIIWGLFKVTDSMLAEANDPTGPGWVRMNNLEYWNPFPEYTPLKQSYNVGDENLLLSQRYNYRQIFPNTKDPSGIPYSGVSSENAQSKPSHKFADVGTSRLWGSSIYRATFQYVQWEELKKTSQPFVGSNAKGENPYGGTTVQVWVKVTGTGASVEQGVTYWYHPVFQAFYTIPSSVNYLIGAVGDTTTDSLREGKILALIAQGNTRAQAIALIDSQPSAPGAAGGSGGSGGAGGNAAGNAAGNAGSSSGGNKNGSQSEQATAPKAAIKATVRVRGNFGFVAPGEPEGGEPQMVQYYKSGDSQLQTTARHYFLPKPNQVNYQNLGSEWTEIERVGRIPLVDWKNYRLMKVSFQFLVIPDNTYRTGAFGETADDGITFSIDEKLENLRNMAARPYPVILYGFDDLLINANPFSMSTGAGVQFVISELTISSLIRTSTGSINRATCDITLQEVPIEYINIISLPKLVPGQIIPPRPPTINPPEFGERDAFTGRIKTYPGQTFSPQGE
jgi:hypothetical protein